MSANSHRVARRISSFLSSPSLHYFRDASIFVPPANNGFHPAPRRFPPNYCMSPFHPAAPLPPSLPVHSLRSLGLHRSLSLSLRLSLVTLSVFFPSLCAGLIFYELLDDGCSLLGKQPQLSPPGLPACLLISKPAGEPFSLNSLPFTDSLALSIAFFSGSD